MLDPGARGMSGPSSPVIPDGAVRAKGEHRSDPGPPGRFDSLHKVPDSLAPAGLGFRDDGWRRVRLAAWRDSDLFYSSTRSKLALKERAGHAVACHAVEAGRI